MAKDAEQLAAQGNRLAELRALARVSQETAAHKIGVSTRAYREWELGRGGFSDDNIKAAAHYFGTTPDYIEYGVIRRKRSETPDLGNAVLDRIEDKLDQILALLTPAPGEKVAVELEERLPRRLDEAVGSQKPPVPARSARKRAGRTRTRA